jgi:hypothetical protein
VDEYVRLFRDLGFPVAVAAFVLLRLEGRLRELTSAITELRVCIARSRQADHQGPPPDRAS